MVHLGYEAQLEAHFDLFGYNAYLDTRYVHGLCRMYYGLKKHFRRTGWNLYVMWVMWNLVLVRLEMLLVSVRGR
jgi:hypothetical protein